MPDDPDQLSRDRERLAELEGYASAFRKHQSIKMLGISRPAERLVLHVGCRYTAAQQLK